MIAAGSSGLVDLLVPEELVAEAKAYASQLPGLQLGEASVYDLELLATGALSPLDRFMGRADYERVRQEQRLSTGQFFPLPLTLSLSNDQRLPLEQDIALRTPTNDLVGIMTVEEIYEAESARNVSGPLRILRLPVRYDFRDLRLTPAQVRQRLQRFAAGPVVALHTTGPLLRVHEAAMDRVSGTVLLQAVVGPEGAGCVDPYTRIRTHRAFAESTSRPVVLGLLPLARGASGPRSVGLHALIARNYGATHYLICPPGQRRALLEPPGPRQDELGVQLVALDELVYLPYEDRFEERSRVPAGTQVRQVSPEDLRHPPDWLVSRPIREVLAEALPPPAHQGVCIWFTGLSGSGKSATAQVLSVLLQERGRKVTLLDGDVVRTHLSKGLGFSREDRDTNVRRIGFVAGEVVRHGGAVVCAAISPYRATRAEVREMVGASQFIEVFVDTPLEECERRDVKGLYAMARRGEINGWTGIDDPYEPPEQPEVALETVSSSVEDNARRILAVLESRGFVRGGGVRRT